VRSENWTTGNC